MAGGAGSIAAVRPRRRSPHRRHAAVEGRRTLDRDSRRRSDTYAVEFRAGEPTHVRFDGLATSMKRIELWLPQNCSVEVRDLRIGDTAMIQPALRDGRSWLHYGSSISHCNEADGPTETWPAIAARLAGVDLTRFGF